MSYINSPFGKKDDYELKVPPVTKNEPKTEQATKGWFETFTSYASLATQVVKTVYSVSYSTDEKKEMIEEANNQILGELGETEGPLFVKLSNMMGHKASALAEKKLGANLTYYMDLGFLGQTFIAQAFANLAQQLNANKDTIANYDNQPVLLSLLSLVIKNSSSHLNLDSLQAIESQYSEDKKAVNVFFQEHYSADDIKLGKKLLEKYFNAATQDEKQTILQEELFVDYFNNELNETENAEVEQFLHHLDKLDNRNRELKSLFHEFADDLLTFIFPGKFQDPAIQKFIQGEDLFNKTYGFAQGFIADSLFTEYDSVEMNNYQAHTLQDKLHLDVKPIIQAPAKFVTEYAKNYIQFNPDLPDMTSNMLASGLGAPNEEVEDLSNWVVESLQAATHSSDPQFKGVLKYTNKKVDVLTESMLSWGLSALFKTEKIEGTQVLQKFIDTMNQKLQSSDEETAFTKELLGFIDEMPIPSTVKAALLAKFKKAPKVEGEPQKAIEDYEKEMRENLVKADRFHKESIVAIKKYEGGDELLKFVENATNEIMNYLKTKNVGLVSEFELQDTIDTMLNEFLPGLKMDDNLKNLLRSNLELSNADHLSNLSEKTIRTILCAGLKTAIDANFDTQLNVADQLYSRINTSLKGTINYLISVDDPSLDEAIAIQARIDAENKRLTALKGKIVEQPKIVSKELQSAVDAVILSASRVRSAKKYIEELKKREGAKDITLKSAKQEYALRQTEYQNKLALFEDVRGKTQESSSDLSKWLYVTLLTREQIEMVGKQIQTLEKELDPHLAVYQSLSNNLMAFIGLDKKETLKIPEKVINQAWPKIEDAKNVIIPRLLFKMASPVIANVKEIQANKEKLDRLSGSPFLSQLSEAVADDLFTQVPKRLQSLEPLSNEVFQLLAGRNGSESELKALTDQILLHAREPEIHGKLTTKKLVEAFILAMEEELPMNDIQAMKDFLSQNKVKERVLSINMTLDEVADKIKAISPVFDQKMVDLLLNEITTNFDPNSAGSIPIKEIVNGTLLKFLIPLAEKNPPQGTQDPIIVLTEKMLALATLKFKEARTRPFEEVAKEIESAILAPDGFGIIEAIETLPVQIREKALEGIKGKIASNLVSVQKSVQTYNTMQQTAAIASKNVVNGVANVVAHTAMNNLPSTLNEVAGDGELKMVNKIAANVDRNLELAAQEYKVADVLMHYAQGGTLRNLISNQIVEVAKTENLLPEKAMAAELVRSLVAGPLNNVVGACLKFEADHKQEFDHLFMVNLVKAASDHLTTLNDAEARAKGDKRSTIENEDFIQAGQVNALLHPAVPKTLPDYRHTFDAISKKLDLTMSTEKEAEVMGAISKLVEDEQLNGLPITNERIHEALMPLLFGSLKLTDAAKKAYTDKLDFVDQDTKSLKMILIEEMSAPAMHRQKVIYSPAAKSLLKMLFPHGKDDLIFVPEDVRDQTWKLFKNNLFPSVLPMVTDSLLDPGTMNTIFLNVLKNAKASLDKEIVLGPEMKEPPSELDEAASSLMIQIMKRLDLPSTARNVIIDPVTGEITPSMKKTLGDALRGQILNQTFLKDTLESALNNVVSGGPVTLDKRSKAEKAAHQQDVVEPQIRKAAKAVVDSSVSYFFRSKWKVAQTKFDDLVYRTLGRVGAAIKKGLDAIFRFIFFTIIGTILSWTLFPLIKRIIYKYLSIDKNMDNLLDPLRRIPKDQTVNQAYAVYNENLVYKLIDGVKKSVKETLEKSMLAMAADEPSDSEESFEE